MAKCEGTGLTVETSTNGAIVLIIVTFFPFALVYEKLQLPLVEFCRFMVL